MSDLPHHTHPLRAGLGIAALVLGGFGIGTTEFVTMGLLPEIAADLGATIPETAHVISAYAIGVVVGAPAIAVLGARIPRRALLLGLAAVILLGNAWGALAPDASSLLAARFVAGLPHGAFFGVAALTASAMVDPSRRGRAVGRVMLGIPFATLAGVPLATWLGQHVGWRSAYWLVVGVMAVCVLAVWLVIRPMGTDHTTSARRELAGFGRPQLWLTALIATFGFAGMFAMYSYIAPTVTEVTRLPASWVPLALFAFGLGSVIGNEVAGRLADWSVFRSLTVGCAGLGLLLAVFSVASASSVALLPTLFCLAMAGSLLTVNLQLQMMADAGAAQTLGAALNHAALNLANAMGAFLGGVVITAGLGYPATSVLGALLSLIGLGCIAWYAAARRRWRDADDLVTDRRTELSEPHW